MDNLPEKEESHETQAVLAIRDTAKKMIDDLQKEIRYMTDNLSKAVTDANKNKIELFKRDLDMAQLEKSIKKAVQFIEANGHWVLCETNLTDSKCNCGYDNLLKELKNNG